MWSYEGSIAISALLLFPAFCAGDEAVAGINAPRPVSPAGARATAAALGVDALGNAFVHFVADGKSFVAGVGASFSGSWLLSEINIPPESPSIEVNRLEVSHVVFAREDNELGSRGREIYISSNRGGDFALPRNISGNRIDDSSPALALDPSGAPRLAWVQEGEWGPVIVHLRNGAAPREVARGDRPCLAVGLDGRSAIAFQDGEAIRVAVEEPGGFVPAAEIDRALPGAEVRPVIGVDGGGRMVVAFAAGGELRISTGTGAAFSAPRIADRGLPVDAIASGKVGDDGRLVLAYVKDGDLFVLRGDPGDVLQPERVTATPEEESCPSVREDPAGNLHISFIRDGVVYYANTATPPRADFSVEPGAGELPLSVRFDDLSEGEILTWRWSFGDGETSTERAPLHEYRRVGTFTVELEVAGPGGRSRLAREAAVIVADPSFTMRVADLDVPAGQAGARTVVIGYNREEIQGFQVAGRFDPARISLTAITLDGTATAAYAPEFFEPSISAEDGTFQAGVILDSATPFDGRKMPPGDDVALLGLILDVPHGAGDGDTTIELDLSADPSSIGSIYTVDGFTRLPWLIPGRVRVLRPQATFIRADADGDGLVALADVVLGLRSLYQGGGPLPCPDAADGDDSGLLDASDAIRVLTFLFLGGLPPPAPFPGGGADPTEDGLGPCGR